MKYKNHYSGVRKSSKEITSSMFRIMFENASKNDGRTFMVSSVKSCTLEKDWLIYLMINLFNDLSTAWIIKWSNKWLIFDWLIDQLTDFIIDSLIDWFILWFKID